LLYAAGSMMCLFHAKALIERRSDGRAVPWVMPRLTHDFSVTRRL